MAALRVTRTWWLMERPVLAAPLFREMSRNWRPVDRRERRAAPFKLALPVSPVVKVTRSWFGLKKKVIAPKTAEQIKAAANTSTSTWNPWLMMK